MERLPEPVPFVDGAIVPLRGEPHRVRFTGPQRYSRVVWSEHDAEPAPAPAASFSLAEWRNFSALRFNKPIPCLYVSGDREHAPRRFHDWLRSEVRKDIAASVEKYAASLACTPKRITIRDQATRWGSCSSSGTLSFSWRLIFAPPFVLDYVAAHEVAHLLEMNHGPRFWRLMRDAVPGMQRARSWLKTCGAELHRFGSDF